MGSQTEIESSSDHARSDEYSWLTADMLRTAQQHHVRLSAMADVKASIIMTAASIVLTMVIGLLIDHGARASLVESGGLVVVALPFAAFAVVPRYRPHPGIGDNTERPGHLNLPFFEHFEGIPAERYMDEVEQVSRSSEAIMRTEATHIYRLGTHLGVGKNRFLRVAYIVFSLGIVVAGIVELLDQSF